MSAAGLPPAPASRAGGDRRVRVTQSGVASLTTVSGPVRAPVTAWHETTGQRR